MKHISELTKEYLIELAKNNPEAAAGYAWEVRQTLNAEIKQKRQLQALLFEAAQWIGAAIAQGAFKDCALPEAPKALLNEIALTVRGEK